MGVNKRVPGMEFVGKRAGGRVDDTAASGSLIMADIFLLLVRLGTMRPLSSVRMILRMVHFDVKFQKDLKKPRQK